MQQHTDISLRAVSLLAAQAATAPINPQTLACFAEFDAGGYHAEAGPTLDHLPMPRAIEACDFLIAAALDLLNVNPGCGVLIVQYDSATQLSAFFIPDASVAYIEHAPSATRH